MRNKKFKVASGILVLILSVVFWQVASKRARPNGEVVKEIHPTQGSIQSIISTTGTVLPKNRLEVKPPVNGRIEEILVQEGEKVRAGQTLAWMSSTERAALLDAARGQGKEALEYWEEAYKAIQLTSPIDGEVIVATTQPGQTVTTSEAVVVLSDELIVRAQVDETDIGKVKLGQGAVVTLDAYPDTKIRSTVGHIYYESKTVNNVTIYEVDLLPENVPLFFRSGMNATINFIEKTAENAVIIPADAVLKEKDETYVLMKQANRKEPVKRPVKLGISDDKDVEVVSGIGLNDVIIMKTKRYSLPKGNTGTNPFMPLRSRAR